MICSVYNGCRSVTCVAELSEFIREIISFFYSLLQKIAAALLYIRIGDVATVQWVDNFGNWKILCYILKSPIFRHTTISSSYLSIPCNHTSSTYESLPETSSSARHRLESYTSPSKFTISVLFSPGSTLRIGTSGWSKIKWFVSAEKATFTAQSARGHWIGRREHSDIIWLLIWAFVEELGSSLCTRLQ